MPPAIEVLGRDFTFPNKVDGLPESISSFEDLKIDSFTTNDGIKLSYWEAGEGPSLVMLPGWGAHGATYINLLYLLRKHYRVFVLDVRNHGLSDKTTKGLKISRQAMDLKQFCEHLGLSSAFFCGWSMGCSQLWSFIDLFGTSMIRKLALVDQAPSIYKHSDWSKEETVKAGSFVTHVEPAIEMITGKIPVDRKVMDTDLLSHYRPHEIPEFGNSEALVAEFIERDIEHLKLVLFDHFKNDWRDVISEKIDVPTVIFTGENSDWVESQRWMQRSIAGSKIHVYGANEHGDHFLMVKDPKRFVEDLRSFLEA